MKIKQIAVFAAMAMFAMTAWSGEEVKHKMAIAIVQSDGDHEMLIEIDGADIELQNMQIGENRSIVDDDGRSILVTREEKGFTFNIDGKIVEMPDFMNHEEGNVWISDDDHMTDVVVDVQMLHGSMAAKSMMDSETVMIISGKEIDASTQGVIRTALQTAGHQSVEFVGGGEDGGPHGVHVVRKVVELTD
jgi:hypothetical protein